MPMHRLLFAVATAVNTHPRVPASSSSLCGPNESFRERSLRWSALGFFLLLVGLGSTAATAHTVEYTISGDSLTLSTGPNPATWAFSFSTANEPTLSLGHNPSTEGFRLLVSGAGANAGRSFMIDLDSTAWSYQPSPGVWTYSDPSGAEAGVTDVSIGDGGVSIQASGPNWPWEVTGSQDEIWVQFWIEDESYCANFSASTGANFSFNQAALVMASNASAPTICPATQCGNDVVEAGEACDDGNSNELDGCTSLCEIGECNAPEYASTWEAIQSLIIEPHNCLICHGPVPLANSLVLSPELAYDNLIRVPSANSFNNDFYIQPGDPNTSFFYNKIANRTLGTPLGNNEGAGMPSSLATPVSEEHLQAIKEWIYGSAPETGVVEAATDRKSTR
ncbi:MAG: hypothetical protein VCC04_05070, partial [Myxococcota bacterium]